MHTLILCTSVITDVHVFTMSCDIWCGHFVMEYVLNTIQNDYFSTGSSSIMAGYNT